MRSRIAGWLALALLLGGGPRAGAEATCTAEGYVLDGEGNPLPDVKVLLQYKGHNPQRYRTKTDKKGKFIHVNVYEGVYDITFTKEGVGDVQVKDFRIREIPPLEKAPVFRLGSQKKVVAPPPGADATAPADPAAPVAPAGPDPAVMAADLQKAAEAFSAGRYDEAAATYEAVLAQAPGLALGHHNLGLVYRKKGDLAKAEAEFRKASELKPDFADAHGALSVLLAGQGKPEAALVEAQQAVAAAPENTQYLFNLGVLQKDTGKGAEAKETFTKLEALDPTNAEVQFHLGTALLGLGQVPEAVAHLEKYLATAPADAPNVAAAKGIVAAMAKKK
jgi:Tfp pilus assembly protein PilF